MLKIKGVVSSGVKHFTNRMTRYPSVLSEAVGEDLVVGTLNINISRGLQIKPTVWVAGSKFEDEFEDYLIEKCLVNNIAAYRIRPYMHQIGGLGYVGAGGHGDFIIEILCKYHLRTHLGLDDGDEVELEFDRTDYYL